MNWISVKDKMPTERGRMLVFMPDFEPDWHITILHYDPRNDSWEDDNGWEWFSSEEVVTHWMPLPEPPSKQKPCPINMAPCNGCNSSCPNRSYE